MKFFRGVSLAKGSQLRILFLLAGILLVTLAIQAFMIKEGFEEMGEAVEREPGEPLVRQPSEPLVRQPSDPLTTQPVRYLTEGQEEQLDKEGIIFEQQRMFEQQQQNTRDLETLKKENDSTDERQDRAINAIQNATFKMIPERKMRSRLDDAASSYNA